MDHKDRLEKDVHVDLSALQVHKALSDHRLS